MPVPARVTSRNATFQLWQVLLTNRAKRTRAGELLVQGVRPITVAVEPAVRRQNLAAEGADDRRDQRLSLCGVIGCPPIGLGSMPLRLASESSRNCPDATTF